jgi:hypothetical protein
MTNPWLQIPLSDYETHMALPNVRQAQLLADILGRALNQYAPRSLALLGCAGGNGLEQVVNRMVDRIVAVDINPAYIEHVRTRWSGRIAGLDLVVGDVQKDDLRLRRLTLFSLVCCSSTWISRWRCRECIRWFARVERW